MNREGENKGNTIIAEEEIISMDKLKAMPDCTFELYEYIKGNLFNTKIVSIIQDLNNYSIVKFIEYSNDKNRSIRNVVTNVLLDKIDKTEDEDDVRLIIENVLFPRLYDVDSGIRLYCLKQIINLIIKKKSNNGIFNLIVNNVTLITNLMNDKGELIRKRSLKILKMLYDKNKNIQIPNIDKLLKDKNIQIRTESLKLYMCLFLDGKISEIDLFHILKEDNFNLNSKVCKDVFKKLNIDVNIDDLHRLSKNTSNTFISKIINYNTLLKLFNEYIKESSNCCSNSYFCLFDVIITNFNITNISIMGDLLETCKDNVNNVIKLVDILYKIDNYLEIPNNLLNRLNTLILNHIKSKTLLEKYLMLLSRIINDFDIKKYLISLLNINKEYINIIVKYINKQEFISENINYLSNTGKCYYILWLLKDKEYEKIQSVLNLEIKLKKDEINILIDFIGYFYDKIKLLNGNTVNIMNEENNLNNLNSILKYVTFKLIEKIRNVNVDEYFIDEINCLYLAKLIKIGIFTSECERLFKYIKIDKLIILFKSINMTEELFKGFINCLLNNKTMKVNDIKLLSRLISKETNKLSNKTFVFNTIKNNINQVDLIDNCYIYFINNLTLNECIVLENLLSKCKFKETLLKKITKNSNLTNNNITFI
ncbi:hypothetical protein HERIO_81 [Hepatospora eriocheir]|uniref:Uncharacterized protein n=1 Tax=Hepatospora eriocheir TaxID=1081669 RepID=A0A1X0QE53_9MICR|nr:hypothetical protein HERIO_81 [Hepatospora eriocheir]